MSDNHLSKKPYMSYKVFDGYDSKGVYGNSESLEKGLENLIIIANSKYNIDVLETIKKLKEKGLI